MIFESFAIAVMLCALAPAVLFSLNLRRYRAPAAAGTAALPKVSVLIPARDEEHAIGAAVRSVLASHGVELEIVVMNDASTDRTASIVADLAAADARVRLEQAPPLPGGWNGKQHACWALAHTARGEILCFVDADVQLDPQALQRTVAFLESSRAALVSGFPRQVTKTTMEWLLLPLIHFVLLGFLPMSKMREGTDPAFAAGCGQFLMVRRAAYFRAGGHAQIRETMHDGLRLPKLLRQNGERTDLVDLTTLASCRMYTSARQVWNGLAKNATEGLGAPVRIIPITALLLLGQVIPYVLLAWLLASRSVVKAELWVFAVVAVAAAALPRVLAVGRFRQPVRSAVAHPFGMVLLLAIQWYALVRRLLGGAVSWKNRAYVED